MDKFREKKLSSSSKKWILRTKNNLYTKKAQLSNIPCRSYYKLEEIDKKYNIFQKEKSVLDLGSSPGGWSYYLKEKKLTIHCCDLLDTMKVKVDKFILGDFFNADIQSNFINYNYIICDMAVNTTGNRWLDNYQNHCLSEEVWLFSKTHLLKNGSFIIKLFESEYTKKYIDNIKNHFQRTIKFKPVSSYKTSSELYLVSISYKALNVS